jgi:enoyl-[acyl-carrier protein] reductase I
MSGLLMGRRGVVFGVANERSIAWGCAKALASQGASLLFSYAGEALEKRVAKLLEQEMPGAPMYPCDVSSDEEIETFFDHVRERWGSLDFIVHSVAFADREDLKKPFVETPRDHFATALDVSAYSLVAVTRAALPIMNEGGSVLAMTYYGAEKVIPNYNVMGVAKAALEASTRYLAADLGPRNIRVNALSAGPLRTLSSSAISGMKLMLDAAEEAAPLKRNVTQDDIAKSAVYLLSDLATGVTGETHHVDCGYNIMGMTSAPPAE